MYVMYPCMLEIKSHIRSADASKRKSGEKTPGLQLDGNFVTYTSSNIGKDVFPELWLFH